MTPALLSVHYHLRPGGVARVIQTTDHILREAAVPHLILSAETLPALDYGTCRSKDLAAPLIEAADSQLGRRPRLWHFHNPFLGKNPALAHAILRLAEAGEAMILQHHDLAEDGRPENLAALEGVVYPHAPHLLHAFLNHRDRDAFLAAGLPPERAALLPNPLPSRHDSHAPPEGPPLLLLPMRGIPRKNLGEMLLLAAAAPPGTRILQGSAPRQPAWRPAYEAWRRFAENENLAVEFDHFARHEPDLAIDRATHLLTTSTCEGFGMIHLEAAGRRRVLGRRLPYLDLEGFPLDGLYDALLVGDRDFGALDDAPQRDLIRAFSRGEMEIAVQHEDQLTPLRSWLQDQLADRTPRDASCALERHSARAHLERLLGHRDQLLAAPRGPITPLDRDRIAQAFP